MEPSFYTLEATINMTLNPNYDPTNDPAQHSKKQNYHTSSRIYNDQQNSTIQPIHDNFL